MAVLPKEFWVSGRMYQLSWPRCVFRMNDEPKDFGKLYNSHTPFMVLDHRSGMMDVLMPNRIGRMLPIDPDVASDALDPLIVLPWPLPDAQ